MQSREGPNTREKLPAASLTALGHEVKQDRAVGASARIRRKCGRRAVTQGPVLRHSGPECDTHRPHATAPTVYRGPVHEGAHGTPPQSGPMRGRGEVLVQLRPLVCTLGRKATMVATLRNLFGNSLSLSALSWPRRREAPSQIVHRHGAVTDRPMHHPLCSAQAFRLCGSTCARLDTGRGGGGLTGSVCSFLLMSVGHVQDGRTQTVCAAPRRMGPVVAGPRSARTRPFGVRGHVWRGAGGHQSAQCAKDGLQPRVHGLLLRKRVPRRPRTHPPQYTAAGHTTEADKPKVPQPNPATGSGADWVPRTR